MNKVILMGRLTREPEVRYTQGSEPLAVVKYTLAVNRRFKRPNEADADFINCVAFGKIGEFAEKYFRKGQMVSVVGRLQIRSWDDADGNKRWSTDVVIEDQFFAESKKDSYAGGNTGTPDSYNKSYNNSNVNNKKSDSFDNSDDDGFDPIDDGMDDDDLPF